MFSVFSGDISLVTVGASSHVLSGDLEFSSISGVGDFGLVGVGERIGGGEGDLSFSFSL